MLPLHLADDASSCCSTAPTHPVRAALITLALVAVGLLFAIAASPSIAATSNYHPTAQARDFAGGAGGWTTAPNVTSGACLVLGIATCPSATGTHSSADGGHLRTSFGVVLGGLGGSTTSSWLSPWFTYNGAGGSAPDSLEVSLRQRVTLSDVLGLGGTSASYSAALERQGGGEVALQATTAITTTPGWATVTPAAPQPGALEIGGVYRFRISTTLTSPLVALSATGTVDYDDIVLTATTPGSGGPINTEPPFVVGNPALGSTLTCNPGTWNPAPDSFEYRWYRDGQPIAAATSVNHVVVEADVGKSISCSVRPIVEGTPGDWTDPSEPTDPVSDPEGQPPVNSVSPSVGPGGTPELGQTLTCNTGEWAPAPDEVQFRWYRDGVLVGDANSQSHLVTADDVGHGISCAVRARAGGAWSNWTAQSPRTPDAVNPSAPPDIQQVTKQLKAGIGNRVIALNGKKLRVMRVRCPQVIAPQRCKNLRVTVRVKRNGAKLSATKKLGVAAGKKKSPFIRGKRSQLNRHANRKTAVVELRLNIPGYTAITVNKKVRIKHR